MDNQSFFYLNPDPVIIFDNNFIIVNCNKKAESYFPGLIKEKTRAKELFPERSFSLLKKQLKQNCTVKLEHFIEVDKIPYDAIFYGDKNLFTVQLTVSCKKENIQKDLNKFFELTSDISCLLGLNGYFKKVNDSFLTQLDYTAEKVEAMFYLDLFSKQDKSFAIQIFQSLEEGKELTGLEIKVLSGKGEFRWIQFNAVRIKNEDTIFITGRDITKRKILEQDLIAIEKKYSILMNNFPLILFVVDKNGEYRTVEGRGIEEFDINKSDILHSSIYTFPLPFSFEIDSNKYNMQEAFEIAKEGKEFAGLSYLGERIYDTRLVPLFLDDNFNGLAGIALDITSQIKAAKELVEKEELFRIAVNNFPYGFTILDNQARYKFVNKYVTSLSKRTEENFLGKKDEELYPEEYYKSWVPLREEALSTKKPVTRMVHRDRDGIVKHYKLNYIPVLDSNNEVNQLLGITYDVTEIENSKEALKTSEYEYRQLFENAHDAIIVFDPDSEIILNVNYAACGIYGAEKEKLIGRSLLELSENPERGKKYITETLAGKNYTNFETVQRKIDGSEIYLEVNASVIEYKGKKAILSINRDITERKTAEHEREKLREEKENLLVRLQRQINNMPVGYILMDKNYRITQVNPKAEEIFGYSNNELLFKKPFGLMIPLEHEADFLDTSSYKEDKKQKIISSIKNKTKSGEDIYCEWHNSLALDENGEVSGIMSMVNDVTRRMQYEENNKQLMEKLVDTNERLSSLSKKLIQAQEKERTLLSRELHDEIGQLMTVLKIRSQSLVKNKDPQRLNRMLKENIEIIEDAIEKVRDLSLMLRPSIIDDLGLIPAVRWFLDNQTKKLGIKVRLTADDIDDRLDPNLEISVFRIIQESLTNSVRHSKGDYVVVSITKKDDKLCVSVKDNGSGFNVDEKLANSKSGKSFGLLSMKERTEFMNGELKIKSKPGQGTEVIAEFPFQKKESERGKN